MVNFQSVPTRIRNTRNYLERTPREFCQPGDSAMRRTKGKARTGAVQCEPTLQMLLGPSLWVHLDEIFTLNVRWDERERSDCLRRRGRERSGEQGRCNVVLHRSRRGPNRCQPRRQLGKEPARADLDFRLRSRSLIRRQRSGGTVLHRLPGREWRRCPKTVSGIWVPPPDRHLP